jgi:hypothetical protein
MIQKGAKHTIGKVDESSLSRLWRNNEKHDCGALTAYCIARDCGEGIKYTKKERLQRYKSLTAKLLHKGFGITKLAGIYPENGSTIIGYFVVDSKNTGKLEKELRALGETFNQDSILFIPKNSISGDSDAYLIGTNHCPNNQLGYGKKQPFKKGTLGYTTHIYTELPNGKPLMFTGTGREVQPPGSGYGWWALGLVSKAPWNEVDIENRDEHLYGP